MDTTPERDDMTEAEAHFVLTGVIDFLRELGAKGRAELAEAEREEQAA